MRKIRNVIFNYLLNKAGLPEWFLLYQMGNEIEKRIKICYVNGRIYALDDVEKMPLLSDEIFSQRPKTIFKYFSNIETEEGNFSMEALKNNTVFIKNPRNYNDPYDSYISISEDEYIASRLRHYLTTMCVELTQNDDTISMLNKFAHHVICHINNNSCDIHSITKLFKAVEERRESLARKDFVINLIKHIKEGIDSKKSDEEICQLVFNSVYFTLKDECENQIHNSIGCKVACFTQRYDSILMWSHYANKHKGFCIEYDATATNEDGDELKHYLLPVIYSNHLGNLTQEFTHNIENNKELHTAVYNKAFLRKSIDWKYEHEWRLILPTLVDECDKSIKCFPIKRVYLGSKMCDEQKIKIREICSKHNIEYVCMKLDSSKYEMTKCNNFCGRCEVNIQSYSEHEVAP